MHKKEWRDKTWMQSTHYNSLGFMGIVMSDYAIQALYILSSSHIESCYGNTTVYMHISLHGYYIYNPCVHSLDQFDHYHSHKLITHLKHYVLQWVVSQCECNRSEHVWWPRERRIQQSIVRCKHKKEWMRLGER